MTLSSEVRIGVSQCLDVIFVELSVSSVAPEVIEQSGATTASDIWCAAPTTVPLKLNFEARN